MELLLKQHIFLRIVPKDRVFLESVVNGETTSVKVKDLCRTRWIYRHEAYENFFMLFKHLVSVMTAIIERDDTYGQMNWDSKTVVEANGLLKMYTTFQFIFTFVATMNVMSVIKPISIKLQKRSIDIVGAYDEVKGLTSELLSLRSNDSILHQWYTQAESIAASVNVVPTTPRVTGRQQHRTNVEHATAEEYYRRAIVIPLLDQFIQQLNERFGKTQCVASRLLHLVPSIVHTTEGISRDETISFYKEDLPNEAVINTEIWRWQNKWKEEHIDNCPVTLQSALKECDKEYFPNVHELLCIACTLPVTSCENERANSVLKNLKTYLRSTMGQERLSALALMKIHYITPVNLEDFIDRFKLMSNRRIPL